MLLSSHSSSIQSDHLQRILKIPKEEMDVQFDATDALAAAYCHFIQMSRPTVEHKFSSWKDYAIKKGVLSKDKKKP